MRRKGLHKTVIAAADADSVQERRNLYLGICKGFVEDSAALTGGWVFVVGVQEVTVWLRLRMVTVLSAG